MLQPMVRVRQSSEKRVYLTVCVYWYLYIGGSRTCLVHSTCFPLARKGLVWVCGCSSSETGPKKAQSHVCIGAHGQPPLTAPLRANGKQVE